MVERVKERGGNGGKGVGKGWEEGRKGVGMVERV